jgi:hypothetical protein
MSQKINSKNLSYDTSLPPFLAAMRAKAGGGDQTPSIGRRQLGKKRSDSEEAEDAPVVLDEDGNVVDVDFEKDGTVRQREDEGEEGKADEGEGEAKKEGGTEASTKSAASIGGRKRKVGKVIGDAAEDKTASSGAAKADKDDREDQPKEKKVRKKAKKIKLSFDEEDG